MEGSNSDPVKVSSGFQDQLPATPAASSVLKLAEDKGFEPLTPFGVTA